MESKEPITAEAFFNTHWNLGKPIGEIMVLFAKHHRAKAIEAIYVNCELDSLDVGISEIENVYPESLIK